jgi:putative nucleotidyltransferase with HDIG domain
MTDKELFNKIYHTGKSIEIPVYVVGGYIRDMLLGEPGKDIDFVVVGDAMKFAAQLKRDLKVKNIIVYERFGTFMCHYNDYQLEFVNAREESYEENSRKPKTNKADLWKDLSRRDFTINTLAMDISEEKFGEIIDVFNGREDLKNRLIRTPLAPEKTFIDDPLRMMRAIRFAAQLNFLIDEEAFKSIKDHAKRLDIISMERIQDEFNKILMVDKPSRGIEMLEESGLLDQFFPEFCQLKGIDQRKDFHHKDVFYHTLEVVDNLADKTNKLHMRLAGLFHDIAKPKTKKFIEGTGWTFHGHEVVGERMAGAILKKLKYPKDTITFVKKMVRLHLRPMALIDDQVTDSAIRRLLFSAGDDFEDLMMICRADITSKNPEKVKRYLKNYEYLMQKVVEVEERDRIRNFQPPVSGEEIMKIFNCKPGPLVGRVKKFIEEAILDGKVANEHEACIKYILLNKEIFKN